MSTDPDKATGCPNESDKSVTTELGECGDNLSGDDCKEKKKIPRSVRFPDEDQLVTQYFEPANPWQDVPTTTRSQLAAEYLESCRRHNTPCIDTVLQQIRELPENSIGGGARAPRLTLSECSLTGAAPADALEAVLRKVQFRRLEFEHTTIDDEGAEAIFDMIEYYESATVMCISGPRQYGIRGWQAASRMIKKSAELSELEVSEAALEAMHAPVLARSLRAHTCRLRALTLQRVALAGEPLLCLVIALKSNSSIRELRLGDNRLSVSDAVQLASLLRYNTRLQLLDLSNNQIQDGGAAQLAEALCEQAAQSPPSAAASPLEPHRCTVGGHEARGLAFLVLWNNQLTRNCAPYLSKVLRSSQSLCVLNIGRNALGNEVVRALARGGALVSLGLQAARLGPDAATALADLIRADTKLQRLDLRENRLGVAGLKAILVAMKDNNTLTQIDLDEPPESTNLSAEDTETSLIRRITREIRAACGRNEPPTRHDEDSTHPVHRKISLTCHTACLLRQGLGAGEEERRTRLRSPLPSPGASPAPSPSPSPAGSPVPHPHSRFCVTRVTPERDSSTDSSGSSSSSTPTRLAYCPPSRFRVVQVMEPPQIQVHPATSQPRKSPSRFSVTRNYDTMYNPTPSPPPPSPAPTQPQPQPVIYTQLQNEVVTQLKNEASLCKNDALTQHKKFEVTQSKTGTEVLQKNEGKKFEVTPCKENAARIEAQVKNMADIQTKESKPQVKSEVTVPLVNEPTVKKIVTTQVRNEAMKKGKEESLGQLKSEPDILSQNLVTVSIKNVQSDPVIQDKNKVVTQLADTSVKNTIQIKNEPKDSMTKVLTEPVSQNVLVTVTNDPTNIQTQISHNSMTEVKNASSTQCQNKTDIKIESTIQVKNPTQLSNVEPSQKGKFQVESKSTESLTKEMCECVFECCLERESNKNTPVEPTSRFKTDTVSENKTSETSQVNLTQIKPIESSSHTYYSQVKTGQSQITQPVLQKPSVDTIVESSAESDVESNKNECSRQSSEIPKCKMKIESKSDVSKSICDDSEVEHAKTEHMCEKLKTVSSDNELSNQPQVKSDTQIKSDKLQETSNVEVGETNIKSNINVIDFSINPTLVKSDLKYSDVVKSDKKNCAGKAKVVCDQNKDNAMKNIVAISEELGNIIKEMKVLVKNRDIEHVPADNIVLKKNKSESSLDSPDLEVSRLMEKRREERSVFDSNSSLEISGSSMESLNEQNKTVQELDRRKSGTILSNESSMESASDVTPVNSGNFLNLSLSSNESVSPIFGKTKVIHDSLSSLEASVSSLDSGRHEKVMVTSADSGIEYSLQHPSENREDNSSNEGTLTNNSSLKETIKKPEGFQLLDSLTSSPKRTSSLLDVPALKNKGLDRMRKISWVAPSSSFHIPRPEEKETKPSHLEKLLSLFQHPSSIFSRSLTCDDEKKSTSNTPPRKDSSLTSSFWSWGSTVEKEREEDSSEADSTLSERVQVSFVDESFSRKLDSKTPSTDTDNTLSEFQSFPTQESESAEDKEKVTITTEDLIVQNLELSVIINASKQRSDVVEAKRGDVDLLKEGQEKEEREIARPRSFAAVLKSSGSENSLDKQNSPDNGQSVDKLPSKVIRGIKENISPVNTLTLSMSNTKALAVELERQVKNPTVNAFELKTDPKIEEVKIQSDLAPIATIEEACDDDPLQLEYIDDVKIDKDVSIDNVTLETEKEPKITEGIDLGKDALSYLIYENRDFEIGTENIVKTTAQQGSLAQELKEAEIKEILDLSPELVVDETLQDNVFTSKEPIGIRTSPIVPERAKLKKSNSLEDLSQLQEEKSPKTKTIAFKVPESTPRDIPERRKIRTRSGSSPKSLPESLNKPCPLSKMESILTKKKKKVSSLGKMARDSLLALNMSEEEIAEFRRSYKLTSVESLKSLESVSEDANSQSGNSVDSRCRACLRTSQESLMSLDSITEDCRCTEDCERPGKSTR